jgi:hypothetical protein
VYVEWRVRVDYVMLQAMRLLHECMCVYDISMNVYALCWMGAKTQLFVARDSGVQPVQRCVVAVYRTPLVDMGAPRTKNRFTFMWTNYVLGHNIYIYMGVFRWDPFLT